MHKISITDSLTGTYNRYYFDQKIRSLDKSNHPFTSVITCHSNGLHFLKENFGRVKADSLLKESASVIKSAVGSLGEVIRIAGDEFIILCPSFDENKCQNLINELKHKEETRRSLGIPVLNSYGYASINSCNSLIDAIEAAEQMMHDNMIVQKKDHLSRLEALYDYGSSKNII